jgi:hypothetical protein
MASGQSTWMLDVQTPSRAGSLPQGFGGVPGSTGRQVIPVGAWLARESVGSANINAGYADAIASKLAPAGDWRCAWIYGSPSNYCGSVACPRKRRVSQHQCWICRRLREQARSHRNQVCSQISESPIDHCGSEPAREGVVSVNMDAECADTIASKLAPTGYSVIFSKLR